MDSLPDNIKRDYHRLPDGRTVIFFLNTATGLIVVDVVDADEKSGVEVFRKVVA